MKSDLNTLMFHVFMSYPSLLHSPRIRPNLALAAEDELTGPGDGEDLVALLLEPDRRAFLKMIREHRAHMLDRFVQPVRPAPRRVDDLGLIALVVADDLGRAAAADG